MRNENALRIVYDARLVRQAKFIFENTRGVGRSGASKSAFRREYHPSRPVYNNIVTGSGLIHNLCKSKMQDCYGNINYIDR